MTFGNKMLLESESAKLNRHGRRLRQRHKATRLKTRALKREVDTLFVTKKDRT